MAEESTPITEEVAPDVDGDGEAEEEVAIHAAPSAIPDILKNVETPKLFGRYDASDVVIDDPGLVRYINLFAIGIPHQGAKNASRQFGKAKVSVVERLINGMMRGSEYTGKKLKAYKVVEEAFGIIEERAKANPVQVLVHAIQAAAPKEEITRLRYGGIKVPKAVDCAPQRRLDIAVRNLSKGARDATYKNKKTAAMCLADELIKASKRDMASFAVAKKEDVERVAKSAR